MKLSSSKSKKNCSSCGKEVPITEFYVIKEHYSSKCRKHLSEGVVASRKRRVAREFGKTKLGKELTVMVSDALGGTSLPLETKDQASDVHKAKKTKGEASNG